MVGDPTFGLRGDDLIDIVEIDATGEQQDNQQNARDFLVMLKEASVIGFTCSLATAIFNPGVTAMTRNADPPIPMTADTT